MWRAVSAGCRETAGRRAQTDAEGAAGSTSVTVRFDPATGEFVDEAFGLLGLLGLLVLPPALPLPEEPKHRSATQLRNDTVNARLDRMW
jgi:hypothetical protein